MTEPTLSDDAIRDQWWTTDKAAEETDFAITYLTKLAHNGSVTAKKLQVEHYQQWFIDPESLQTYIAEHSGESTQIRKDYRTHLRKLREARGLNLAEFVRELQRNGIETISRNTVLNWETKPVRRLDLQAIFVLTAYFDVGIDDLFYEVDD